jgi:hypothetical protein
MKMEAKENQRNGAKPCSNGVIEEMASPIMASSVASNQNQ